MAGAGVSNFDLEQLVELVEWAEIPPAVLQRRSDLFTQDLPIQRLAMSLGIQYVAYSSLGTQYGQRRGGGATPVMCNAAVQRIAAEHNVTAAQVRPHDAHALTCLVSRLL
jgi:diketogulonate reductase-like aldo/keto reductase